MTPSLFEVPVCRMQLVRERTVKYSKGLECSDDASAILEGLLDGADREYFVVIALDSQNVPICVQTVGIGTINSCAVYPREVVKAALLCNASAVIVGHNHPSGDPTPSPEDISVTERLQRALKTVDIPLLDHIVVGHQRHSSLCKLGRLVAFHDL